MSQYSMFPNNEINPAFRHIRREEIGVTQPLRRVLACIGRSIDDVVSNPIAKNEVLGYYKLYRQIHRRAEILELERQWNSIPL